MYEAAVRAALRNLPLGGLRVFERIGSTNDEARAWAAAGAADLSLVVADEQTAGRGRGDRTWFTLPGTALAFSLILHPDQGAGMAPGRYAGLGALAISDACALLGLKAAVKWPNDVLIGHKKVAGVLAESTWEGEVLTTTILGIGLNVLEGSVPSGVELAYPATSIQRELGRPIDRMVLLESIVSAALAWRDRLSQPNFLQVWEDRLAFRGQQVVVATDAGEQVAGKVLGLDANGSLRLEVNGKARAVPTGEIHLRPSNDRIG